MLLPPAQRRARRILCATALCAIAVPVGAAAWVRMRTDELAARLTAAGGVPARIGGIDADLTGSIRLTDVRLGGLLAIDELEASVAMASLLGGQLRADEVRVDGPRVAIRIDEHGDSDLAQVARRIAHRGGGGGARRTSGGIRRILVAEGALTATIAGVGVLSAERVELIPDAAGVRVITGPVRLAARTPQVGLELGFSRSAAELGLPDLRFGRVLAVGGSGRVTPGSGAGSGGAGTVVLHDVAAGRLSAHGALELRAAIDDEGIARPIAVEVDPAERAITLHGERVPLAPLAALAPRSVELADTRASGTVTVRRRGHGLAIAVAGNVEHLVVDHRTIASEPVPLGLALEGELTIARDSITVPRAQLTMGAARVTASGWVRRAQLVSGQLDVELASAPCAELLAALPAALRGPLDGLALTGSLGARARLAVDLAGPPGEGAGLSNVLSGGCHVTAEPPEADVRTLIEASEQQLADGSRARIGRGERDFTSLRSVPSYVAQAFVSAEDGRFWQHDGFDLVQIARSFEIDLRERRLARGGSTISQQLVKNAFLTRRRSLDRKLQEAILTWRLEARLDKKQILERYLNIIELGPKVFGLAAAARYWFETTPQELTVRQAAFLAALTSQPTSMARRIRKSGGLDPESTERVAVVLRAMRRDGVISDDTYDAVKYSALHFASTAIAAER